MRGCGRGAGVADERRLRGARSRLPTALPMFHCIVQPRHDWGPPDLANAFPGTCGSRLRRVHESEKYRDYSFTSMLHLRSECNCSFVGM